MPSYAQLASEQVWLDQYVPANLDNVLIKPLRAFFGMGPASIGAPGDNNHLYGRHRSAAWDRSSIYCTDRTYGTTDARDKRGDQNIYRACDVGIQGQTLVDASHRIDELVRSGAAPGVAEWFGTFDGQNVVGWYEGHPSSSDDSHLWHLHVGFWNESADDPATLQAVLAAITGAPPSEPGQGVDMTIMVARSGEGPTAKYWVGDGMYHREVTEDVANRICQSLQHFGAPIKGEHGDHFAQVLSWGNTSPEFVQAIVGPTPYLEGGGSGGGDVSGPVNLTPKAVETVAKATADEIAKDPERDGPDA